LFHKLFFAKIVKNSEVGKWGSVFVNTKKIQIKFINYLGIMLKLGFGLVVVVGPEE
jgi:hypothetical protein